MQTDRSLLITGTHSVGNGVFTMCETGSAPLKSEGAEASSRGHKKVDCR